MLSREYGEISRHAELLGKYDEVRKMLNGMVNKADRFSR